MDCKSNLSVTLMSMSTWSGWSDFEALKKDHPQKTKNTLCKLWVGTISTGFSRFQINTGKYVRGPGGDRRFRVLRLRVWG